MTLTQIQYVLAVAETGTISAAAKRLFIAQPSLTASIKELENELQVTLFRRTNKGVTLTPEGEEFLGYARQVNSQLDLMRERYFGGPCADVFAFPRSTIRSQWRPSWRF